MCLSGRGWCALSWDSFSRMFTSDLSCGTWDLLWQLENSLVEVQELQLQL